LHVHVTYFPKKFGGLRITSNIPLHQQLSTIGIAGRDGLSPLLDRQAPQLSAQCSSDFDFEQGEQYAGRGQRTSHSLREKSWTS
jgi:hypothetical protein